MANRIRSSSRLLSDFAPLEEALRKRVDCPVERMIVELGLTPKRVAVLEKLGYAGSLGWFQTAYRVMRRHRLLGRGLTWEQWLVEYHKRRREVLRHNP
ncbi:MAG: hypothetical protein ACOZE5_18020 [Verrucomicrobiota bacterium]